MPPVSYYGSKARLAPWIVSLFPKHRVYVEPFMGSAAVLFAKPRCVHEIINDADRGVVTFMRVLREQPEEFERLVTLTPYARDEYEEADLTADLSDVELARLWWVRSTQAFGQVSKQNTGWATSISRGSNNARSVYNRIARFAPAAMRLEGVTIENRPALEVIQRYDDRRGVIYCDPPYLGSVRTSIAGGKRPNGDYAHEMLADEQHRALAAVLRECAATVFLSGYPSPLYTELFEGWFYADRRVLRRIGNGSSSKDPHAIERLWSNRPIVEHGALPFDLNIEEPA